MIKVGPDFLSLEADIAQYRRRDHGFSNQPVHLYMTRYWPKIAPYDGCVLILGKAVVIEYLARGRMQKKGPPLAGLFKSMSGRIRTLRAHLPVGADHQECR